MGTKVLFFDDDGELMFDMADSAVHSTSSTGKHGVQIFITDDISIFIATDSVADVIRSLFTRDSVDLTDYGPVVWIDEDGNWSDEKPKDGEV